MISVVTPTFRRPTEIAGLLENLSKQILQPSEILIVDGAPPEEKATEETVAKLSSSVPFSCIYIRQSGGTAIQRNAGIDAASGEFIAFIDDDVRLQPDFFKVTASVFESDLEKKVGGVVGYRTNQYFEATTTQRWRLYRKLRLLTVYEPGRYDFLSGYPINANMQRPFSGVRRVDFMTTACALWRREVFDSGLRFDPFFCDYGILEDAHLSLRAGRNWELVQCGDAHCEELRSPHGRPGSRRIGYKCVVNYYYVFRDVVRPLTWQHQLRFWRFQAFELFRVATSAVRRWRRCDWQELLGRLEGISAVIRGIDSTAKSHATATLLPWSADQ